MALPNSSRVGIGRDVHIAGDPIPIPILPAPFDAAGSSQGHRSRRGFEHGRPNRANPLDQTGKRVCQETARLARQKSKLITTATKTATVTKKKASRFGLAFS